MTEPASGNETSRYLEAIVELTRYRDPPELTAALSRLLNDLIAAKSIRLLEISEDGHEGGVFNPARAGDATVTNLFDPDNLDSIALNEDPYWLKCATTQELVNRETPDGRNVVMPVPGPYNIWALLVIESQTGPPVSFNLLGKLLQVFSNQRFMLARGELDPLTGLYNRQAFFERIRQVAVRAAANPQRRTSRGQPGKNCFALFDIDHFKRINDNYGHLYGDEVLLLFARLMTRSFRREDLLFRYGGEEFAVVLVGVGLDGAGHILERFRRSVEAYDFPQIDHSTVSIGFSAIVTESGVDKVVMCADKALYYAKNHGRNQVCCYEKLVADNKLEPVIMVEGDIELF